MELDRALPPNGNYDAARSAEGKRPARTTPEVSQMAAPLRGQANTSMSESSHGGRTDRRPVGAGLDARKAPKHRNLLPEYHGPVPQGDDENLRGFPMILTPRA